MTERTSLLLDAFFEAITRGDIDAIGTLYADDVEVWHNVTGNALDKTASPELLRFWSSNVQGMRYEILERHLFPGGVVQRHVVHGNANGSELAVDVCIVFHVSNGRIVRIFEYLDPSAVASVFAPT